MTKYKRRNAWNEGGTFDNEDLLWYAKGVAHMQSLPLDDKNSWWFFAAIHGEDIQSDPGWNKIPAPPEVPITPLPPKGIMGRFWNQCQHQSWYFPPWHRGYLVALEAQIRAVVVSLGGPSDWALPYWNYFGTGGHNKMPPAFAEVTLPDGSPNPLFVEARYGPHGDGDIFVRVGGGYLSQKCQSNDVYTGSSPVTDAPGYGAHSNWRE